jgi:hypothetical protein
MPRGENRMKKSTLERLADRVAQLERRVEELESGQTKKDWRRVVGMFEGSEFMPKLDAEIDAIRASERKAAAEGEIT